MRNEYASKVIARNRVGALIRVFATKPETVAYQVDSALHSLDKLRSLSIDGKPIFSRIDFLISNDNRFDDSDCGLTAGVLRERIKTDYAGVPVSVLDVRNGDIYCMLLDYGVVNQMEDRVSYSLVVSHGVSEYITQENVEALIAAMYCKARVAGLAISEIGSLVAKGRIANTFALWHNKSLMTVGGFDLRAAKPERAHLHLHEKVTGSSSEKSAHYGSPEVEYVLAGCEEIIPLVRFLKFFGPSAAVVQPERAYEWRTGAEGKDTDAHLRQLAKLATKEVRQTHMAALEGVTPDILERSIIDLHSSICNPVPVEM